LLCASPCRTIPSISTRHAQAMRLFAQAIHIAVHSNQGRLVRITVAQAASDLAQPVELAWLSVAGRARALDGPVARAAYQEGLDPATFGFWRASAGVVVLGGWLVTRMRRAPLPRSGRCAGRPPCGWRWRRWPGSA
jgi:hypothetical protein